MLLIILVLFLATVTVLAFLYMLLLRRFQELQRPSRVDLERTRMRLLDGFIGVTHPNEHYNEAAEKAVSTQDNREELPYLIAYYSLLAGSTGIYLFRVFGPSPEYVYYVPLLSLLILVFVCSLTVTMTLLIHVTHRYWSLFSGEKPLFMRKARFKSYMQ